MPADALDDFGLSAFVFSRDYLFIENDRRQVIFDAPVACSTLVKGGRQYILIPDGPDFARELLVDKSEDPAVPGVYLVGQEEQLVAYVERLV